MLSALSDENEMKHFGWFVPPIDESEREFIYVSTLFLLNYFYFNLVDASKTIWARSALELQFLDGRITLQRSNKNGK